MGQPVTTNPVMIAFINMTVVFAVLYGLSWVIKLVTLIDPTKKKSITKVENAPAAVATTAETVAPAEYDDNQTIAVIAAAIAAYGYSASQIVSIRPTGGRAWAQAARLEVVNSRNQMY